MSLLMQALRKAESAKKGQGADAVAPDPVQASTAGAVAGELTLEQKEPTQEDLATARQIAAETAAAAPIETVDYFSSEVPPARTPYVAPDGGAAEPAAAQGFDPDRGFQAAPAPSPEPVIPAPVVAPAPPPAPPSVADRQQSAAQAERNEAQARSAAAAVFAAKQRARHQRPLILAACGLLLLSGAAAFGYYQYMKIAQPQPLALPQPVQAAAPADAVPVTAPEPAAPVAGAATAPAVPADSSAPAPVRSRAAPALPTAERADAPSRPAARAAVRSATAAAQRAPRADAGAPAKALQADAAGIELRRTDVPRQVDPALTSAYQSFVAGDSAAARTQYQRVLQKEPDNRDALLGMAAIAVNSGQGAEAGAFYARLVELDPTDAEAASGLASVQRSDPDQAESNLKKVLAANPHTGSAHFALGNVYAQQQRWSEAQQAYFHAVGTAPANADYVFNLAVSLDRLGQNKLALENYRRALQLAHAGSNIKRSAVQARIDQLQREAAAAAR